MTKSNFLNRKLLQLKIGAKYFYCKLPFKSFISSEKHIKSEKKTVQYMWSDRIITQFSKLTSFDSLSMQISYSTNSLTTTTGMQKRYFVHQTTQKEHS